MNKLILVFILLIFQINLSAQNNPVLLDSINLPEGFAIEIYASPVPNARAMDFADDGTLFVGSRRQGYIYAITKEKEIIVLDTGLNMPCGIDYYKGDLYVSSISKILRYNDILEKLHKPKAHVINKKLPTDTWHGWKFIKVGPDGKLYVPVGAPCNICVSENQVYATICRMDLDGKNLEIFAEGVRNTVGFDWDPGDNSLWFTDNGADDMGDDTPPDELNKAITHGMHYGFPYLHGRNLIDPTYWRERPKNTVFTSPRVQLPAHVAALGMRFYDGNMFDERYQGCIFIAEHGSWNRTKKTGYRISLIIPQKNDTPSYEVFASGWLIGETPWGRPADVEIGPDGALYVSDDLANCIYRIYRK